MQAGSVTYQRFPAGKSNHCGNCGHPMTGKSDMHMSTDFDMSVKRDVFERAISDIYDIESRIFERLRGYNSQVGPHWIS